MGSLQLVSSSRDFSKTDATHFQELNAIETQLNLWNQTLQAGALHRSALETKITEQLAGMNMKISTALADIHFQLQKLNDSRAREQSIHLDPSHQMPAFLPPKSMLPSQFGNNFDNCFDLSLEQNLYAAPDAASAPVLMGFNGFNSQFQSSSEFPAASRMLPFADDNAAASAAATIGGASNTSIVIPGPVVEEPLVEDDGALGGATFDNLSSPATQQLVLVKSVLEGSVATAEAAEDKKDEVDATEAAPRDIDLVIPFVQKFKRTHTTYLQCGIHCSEAPMRKDGIGVRCLTDGYDVLDGVTVVETCVLKDALRVTPVEFEKASIMGSLCSDGEDFDLQKLVPSLNLMSAISLNLGVNTLMLELLRWKAPRRKVGIGVSFLSNDLTCETNCKFSLDHLQSYISDSSKCTRKFGLFLKNDWSGEPDLVDRVIWLEVDYLVEFIQFDLYMPAFVAMEMEEDEIGKVVKEDFSLEAVNGSCHLPFHTIESVSRMQASTITTLLVGNGFDNEFENQFVLEFKNKPTKNVTCNLHIPGVLWINLEKAKMTRSIVDRTTIALEDLNLRSRTYFTDLEMKTEEDRSKVEDLRGPPMSVGNLEELIDEIHIILSSSVGPEYYVSILSFVDKDQLEPGCAILMHNKVLSVVVLFQDDVDSMVAVMKIEKAPLKSYADIGGLDIDVVGTNAVRCCIAFGNQKHMPSCIMKSVAAVEQILNEGQEGYWFAETCIPLYLIKVYEEKVVKSKSLDMPKLHRRLHCVIQATHVCSEFILGGGSRMVRAVFVTKVAKESADIRLLHAIHCTFLSLDPRGRGYSSGGGIVIAHLGVNCGGDGVKKKGSMLVDAGTNLVKRVEDGSKYICRKFASLDPRGRGSYQPGSIVMTQGNAGEDCSPEKKGGKERLVCLVKKEKQVEVELLTKFEKSVLLNKSVLLKKKKEKKKLFENCFW